MKMVKIMKCSFNFTCKCSRWSCLIHHENTRNLVLSLMPRIAEHTVIHKCCKGDTPSIHFVKCIWKSDATSLVLLDVLSVQVCVSLNWFKLLGCVLVSWGCCNKVPQTEWFKQWNFILSQFWRHMPNIRVCIGLCSLCRLQERVCPALSRMLVVPWLASASLHSSPVSLLCVQISLFYKTPVIGSWPPYPCITSS